MVCWSLGRGVKAPAGERDFFFFPGIYVGQNGDSEIYLTAHGTQSMLVRGQSQEPQKIPQILQEMPKRSRFGPQSSPSRHPDFRVLQLEVSQRPCSPCPHHDPLPTYPASFSHHSAPKWAGANLGVGALFPVPGD